MCNVEDVCNLSIGVGVYDIVTDKHQLFFIILNSSLAFESFLSTTILKNSRETPVV